MICAYLLHRDRCKDADEVLSFYGQARTLNAKVGLILFNIGSSTGNNNIPIFIPLWSGKFSGIVACEMHARVTSWMTLQFNMWSPDFMSSSLSSHIAVCIHKPYYYY